MKHLFGASTFRLGFAWLGVVLLSLAAPAHASLVTSLQSEVKLLAGSKYKYTYTISNDTTSTLPVVEFTLNVGADADLTDVTGPEGWVVSYANDAVAVDWSSFSPDTDIKPGAATTFSFVSVLAPAAQDYSILGVSVDPFGIETNQGRVVSPAASTVAEPSSFLPLLLGAIVTGCRLNPFRRRTPGAG